MKDKNDDLGVVVVGTVGCAAVVALAIAAVCTAYQDGYKTAYQDGYKAGIKDSPGVTVHGDQIIINTNSNLFPFSGNGNKGGKHE